ncbi:DUF2255 family protein [Nakamurella leprariae]|uniref:DUF2255 family protein n=1 Tax=Nakamurella leprariae TaxID=2803911 RepID=A0A938YG84_9ACTN|nr:DUF2255 family protein [Nakamurella leprariae]
MPRDRVSSSPGATRARANRSRVRVPDLEINVMVTDVGTGPDRFRDRVDAAYRAKDHRYGRSADAMTRDGTAASTLRLTSGPAAERPGD